MNLVKELYYSWIWILKNIEFKAVFLETKTLSKTSTAVCTRGASILLAVNWTSEQCRGWRARQIYSTWRVVICRLLDRSQEIIIQPNWLDYRLLDVRLILLLQDQAIVGYTKIFLLLLLEYAFLFNNCFCLNMVEDCVSVKSRTTNKVGNKVYERTPDSKQMKPSGSKKEGKCGEETRLFTTSGGLQPWKSAWLHMNSNALCTAHLFNIPKYTI